MLSRPAYLLIVTLGASLASFGFLTGVVIGLAAGVSLAGLAGGLLVAAALSIGWLVCVRWAWRRFPKPPSKPSK